MFLFYCLLFHLTSASFNLYDSDPSPTRDYYDCFYSYLKWKESINIRPKVSYCIRPETSNSIINDQCYGKIYMFEQMKSENITVDDLFVWDATIATIDQYQQYLEGDHILIPNKSSLYCRCMFNGQFGSRCQYQFDLLDQQFDEQVLNFFQLKKRYPLNKVIPHLSTENLTCYNDILCNHSALCLDWKQVCNGVNDCENGVDEINCWQLEMNQCVDSTQYRCRNGMCIERQFAFDDIYDCLDGSDEIDDEKRKIRCQQYPFGECEEFNCGWMTYPIDDNSDCFMNSVSSFVQSQLYTRNLHLFPLQQQQVNRKDTFNLLCWEYMICKLDLVNVIKVKFCSFLCSPSDRDCSLAIKEKCPTKFFFPINRTVAFPPLYFLYNTNSTTWKSGFTLPESICDVKECYKLTNMGSAYIENYHSLLKIVITAFSSININDISCLNYSLLYSCSSSLRCLSRHRLNDLYSDCVFNDDEIVQHARTIPVDRYNCTNRNGDEISVPRQLVQHNRCIPQITCTSSNDIGCYLLRNGSSTPLAYYLFQDFCNGVVNRKLVTDEADCQEFSLSCSSRSRACTGIWDCNNGYDEINCGSQTYYLNQHCGEEEHYCFQFDTYELGCLHVDRANDGQIDCIGASDERFVYCPNKHPDEITRRFRCLSEPLCIRVEQVCDGNQDCPLNDDELMCPWRMKSECQNGTFACKNRTCLSESERCNNQNECRNGEDEWFCDMIRYRHFKPQFRLSTDFTQYPIRDEMSNEMTIKNWSKLKQRRSVKRADLKQDELFDYYIAYYCNHGVLVSSWDTKGLECFCSPAYFGHRCQFQSHRLTVYLQVEIDKRLRQSVFKLSVCLISTDDEERTIMCDYVTHFESNERIFKHIIYLVYPRSHITSNYSVRITAYATTLSTVMLHSAWYYKIAFSFLPVNRLTAVIRIENTTEQYKNNCILYRNDNTRHYCFHAPLSPLLCANDSLFVDGYCVCPLNKWGTGCYIRSNICEKMNDSCKNGGICYPLVERLSYFCICDDQHFGQFCQYNRSKVAISLMNNHYSISIMPFVIVHFLEIDEALGALIIKDRLLFHRVPLSSILISLFKQERLSTFIYTQIYFDTRTVYGEYHLVSLLRRVRSLQTSVLPSNRCPHIRELLNHTVNNFPYFKRVKFYQKACYVWGIKCFYDEQYMCLCDNFARYDCFRFDHDASDCSSLDYCLNEGRCIQPLQTDLTFDFGCVCPACYYGELCQFTTAQYSLSLDALVSSEILLGKSLHNLPTLIKITLSLVMLMVIIGLMANSLSIISLCQKTGHEVGCGLYLLTLCITSQLGLLTFGARFIHLLIMQTSSRKKAAAFDYVSCISLEFLFSVTSSIFDWLTACIAIERALVAGKGVRFNKKLSRKLSQMLVIIVVVLNSVSQVHELFSREVIADPRSSGHSWCVMKFRYTWLVKYEIITNILHLTLPFLINLISTVIFLLCLSLRKSQLMTNNGSYYTTLKQQILLYRAFVISPIILVILELPRLVLLFAFACIKFPWQKYVYLLSYFLSTMPLTGSLVIFVLPAPTYRNELKQWLVRCFPRT